MSRARVKSPSAGAALRKKVAGLRQKLAEAQGTLEAIRRGEVDALVISAKNGGPQVYSLTGSEEPYRVYIEHMQEGAVTVSADGLILYCNQRFAEMLGLPLERVIGAPLPPRIPPEDWKAVFGVIVGRDDVVKHEGLLLPPAGSPLPVHFAASKLPVGAETVICLVVTDLTAQREKTALRLAKEVAEKANAEKDEWLAKLSHELRTPLTPILLAAGRLERDETVPAPARAELTMMRRNVELEARLIDDLLDLTRVSHRKLELRLGPVDLPVAVQQAIAICQSEIDAKRLKVGFSAAAARPVVEGDAVRLQQAVWNLIRNAVKFTPEGGEIAVRLGHRGPAIFVEVRDSGMGFDAGWAPRLFAPFVQGDVEVTRRFGGLGLGLAITRAIVEAHQGRVSAHSEGPGRGATFTLELPLGKSAEAAGTAASDAIPGPAGPARARRLLVVEDHADTRRALELVLKRAKHSVKSAGTAREALALAEAHPFDFVISDLGLPDRSGLELMAELRERHGLTGIALSGFGMEADIVRSRAAGFSHHLTKPISADRLMQLVDGMP